RTGPYKESGVDIAAGNKLVDMIKPLAKARCNAELGGFAGLFDLKAAGFVDPVLVSGTDGVGTKLKVAQACGRHDTLGQDLVAMCVNDVLAQGAEPLFFLDYFSCGRLDVGVASAVIGGVAAACQLAGCALLDRLRRERERDRLRRGGERERQAVYAAGEYDLAGFCVGAVERPALLPRLAAIAEGDLLLGVASSGVHSNGFSLVRRVLERAGLAYDSPAPFGEPGRTVGEVLLTPTKIYSRLLLPILRSGADAGALSEEEMARTFNCGLGAVLVVAPPDAQRVLRQLQAHEEAWIVGSLAHKQPAQRRGGRRGRQQGRDCCHGDASTTPPPPAPPHKRARVAVLISGTGTNLQALIEQAKRPSSAAEIVLVISNRPGVLGLKRASLAGIQTRVVDHKQYGSRAEFDATIDRVLEDFRAEVVCKLLNIHPSLLPSFKGVNAQKQALQAGARVSGCTVHFVAEEVDAGAIVAQEAVAVAPGDTEESLSERIRRAEHKAFPAAMELVASGAVRLGEDGRVVWESAAHHEP
ncbi:hypothetical protein CRUP_007062, partial [Coryphaenoides rupestris]